MFNSAMCERNALSPINVKAIVLLHTMQIAFFESPLTCLTHLYSSTVNHLWLKLHFPGILQRNQRQRNVSTLLSQVSSMWHAQEHYNSYTQLLINLVSAHILGRVRFCLKFYIILCIFFFTKLKRKNTLIFTIQLSWYSSESMLAKIQGLFKTLWWNSRTFQGFSLKFKYFSRLCEHCKLVWM